MEHLLVGVPYGEAGATFACVRVLMGNLGVGELVVILLIVLVIFGGGKLPAIGDALGKSIRNFKKAATETDDEKPADKQA